MEGILIDNIEIAEKAENIISDIKNNIYQRLFWEKHVSLMGGSTGEILFLLGYHELTNQAEALEKAITRMEQIIEVIDFNFIGYSFAYGLSGIGWCIDLMYSNGYIDNCSDEIFQEADQLIFKMSIETLKNGNYDYLSGGLGAAFYFLNKTEAPITLIKEYIHIINCVKYKNGNKYYLYENEFKQSCNLGLSHGIPSIISFLIYTYNKNIEQDLCLDLIRGFTNYILNMQNDITKSFTYFSYSSANPSHPTRLAWCYGDLSISYILYSAAIVLNDNRVLDSANEILHHTLKRNDLSKNMVIDTCLCHGTSGIASIYQRLFNKSNQESYKQAFSYWTNKTIELSCYDLNLEGHLFYKTDRFIPMSGFLEGASGVGLSLISGLKNIRLNWQDCLLLY